VLELLGRFSLEKIYAGAADRDAYQHLVITLLAQLKAIFDLQRLTIPSDTTHVGWYLGFLVSWEVALRSVELALQTVAEGREYLWEHRQLRDRYLAEFLLSALRVLTLHPKAPANQRTRDRRERFARIHGTLERVFDSYPGPKSFLLEVCKEVTGQLHIDPDALALPSRFRSELPPLTSELYPLPPCLQTASVSELAPPNGFGNWLAQFLALRDVSQFVIAASIQYAANGETRDMRLQASSARARNAVLTALDNLRTPPHLSRVEMVAAFSTPFRIILPDTLDLSRRDAFGSRVDECELDALDSLGTKLKERQITHRVSDREMVHNVSQIVRNLLLQDDPGGSFAPTRPGLYVVNCPGCHFTGASQLRSLGIQLPVRFVPGFRTSTALLPTNMFISFVFFQVGPRDHGRDSSSAKLNMRDLQRGRHHRPRGPDGAANLGIGGVPSPGCRHHQRGAAPTNTVPVRAAKTNRNRRPIHSWLRQQRAEHLTRKAPPARVTWTVPSYKARTTKPDAG
jgi:hypothetical protein